MHNRLQPNNEYDARVYLTAFAAVQDTSAPPFWSERFDRDRNYPNVVGIAQAHVYNNHSFDLWTPMWQASLEPVDDFNYWVSRLESERDDLAKIPVVNTEGWEELTDYLRRIEPLAEVMLRH